MPLDKQVHEQICFLWANPVSFLFIFVFSNTYFSFYNKQMWKSSIWCRDSNSRPLEHKTRAPALRTKFVMLTLAVNWTHEQAHERTPSQLLKETKSLASEWYDYSSGLCGRLTHCLLVVGFNAFNAKTESGTNIFSFKERRFVGMEWTKFKQNCLI